MTDQPFLARLTFPKPAPKRRQRGKKASAAGLVVGYLVPYENGFRLDTEIDDENDKAAARFCDEACAMNAITALPDDILQRATDCRAVLLAG